MGSLVSEAVPSAVIPRDRLVVSSRRPVSDGVVEFELARPDGGRLPDWAPGAHIDVVLPDGVVRQYSLCGDRRDALRYRIAVQREPLGRGGSAALHDRVGVGDMLAFGGPRNNFRLAPAAPVPVRRRRDRHHAAHADDRAGRAPRHRVGAALPRAKQAAACLPRRARRLRGAGRRALRRRTGPRRVECVEARRPAHPGVRVRSRAAPRRRSSSGVRSRADSPRNWSGSSRPSRAMCRRRDSR